MPARSWKNMPARSWKNMPARSWKNMPARSTIRTLTWHYARDSPSFAIFFSLFSSSVFLRAAFRSSWFLRRSFICLLTCMVDGQKQALAQRAYLTWFYVPGPGGARYCMLQQFYAATMTPRGEKNGPQKAEWMHDESVVLKNTQFYLDK